MMKKVCLFSMLAVIPTALFALNGKTLLNYMAYESIFWDVNNPSSSYTAQYLDKVVGRPFDVLVFSPWLGFGAVAGKLSNATFPKYQPQAGSVWMRNMRNELPALLARNIDPIAETVKWCRKNKREAVVALPVNFWNTHSWVPDQKNAQNSWRCFMYSEFLVKNPECRINPDGKQSTPYCDGGHVGQSFADYTNAKVRDKFSAIACEIASKYDIDGIMIDFGMRPAIFRSVAGGATAAPKEVTMLTEMMKKIQAACKQASARLGHKVEFSARVPDSVGYCKDIGIDLQGWFDSKLLDFVVLGGYFQLNRWNVTGDLAAKAGIPWYASFTQSNITVFNDSGYEGDDERLWRNKADACRARMADVLLCKGAGCMYTMGMHFEVRMIEDAICKYDANENKFANKRYFVSYTNDQNANRFLKDGVKHRGQQSLISNIPVDLAKGASKYKINVWDDFASLKSAGKMPKVSLATEISLPSGVDTIITFNGKEVKPYKKRSGVQYYDVATLIKTGENDVMIKAKGKNKRGGTAKLGNIAVEVEFPKK